MMNKLLLIIGLFTLLQCTDDKTKVDVSAINNLWHYKHEATFGVDITDQTAKDISLIVRNNEEYPYSNIRFIVTIQKEKNPPIAVDTLNYIIANPDGSWIGKGFGTVKESTLLYKEKYTFPAKGKYSIKISQAMRKDSLKGIEDIGIKIEPHKP